MQGGVCQCHGANAKLCCYDARLFDVDESTKEWKVSQCNNYARKEGLCYKHGNQPVPICGRRKEKLCWDENEIWTAGKLNAPTCNPKMEQAFAMIAM